MKKLLKLTPAIPLCLCVGLTFSARATITGQWDFKAGNYDATIGLPMDTYDSVTKQNTLFGSTTTFGISPIGGQPTNVMHFPKAQAPDQPGGYLAPTGGNPNGGNINQYTVIMDVLFTNTPALGSTYNLFAADSGGQFYVNPSGAVAYSGGIGTAPG